jgi:hypothetical protein
MKNKVIPLLTVLGISMFCGIVGISIGMGSVITPVNQVVGSIICGKQQLTINQNTEYATADYYRPGEGVVTIKAYCVNSQTGVKRDITSTLQIISGTIYGLIIFILAMIRFNWVARRLNKSWEKLFEPTVSRRSNTG